MKILFFILITFQSLAQFPAILATQNKGSSPPPVPSVGDYYVGGSGASDTNPGSAIAPFATIQKSASVAVAGDVIRIRSGTYRETITPATSGTIGNEIIFEADAGATPIISGLEDASGGWTVHSGNIYKKTITLPVTGYATGLGNGMYGNAVEANSVLANTKILANQIIRNGNAMVIEASWPKNLKTQDDYFKMAATGTVSTSQWRHSSQLGSGGVLGPGSIVDAGLSGLTSLVGAKVISQGWYVSNSGTVTSHVGTTINTTTDNTRYSGPGPFWRFYRLTNQLQFLTQENEFYYSGTTLYLWQPGGGSPTGLEYKARNHGFDLSGKIYIKIRGLTFIGCEPVTGNTSTSNITIDNIRASYMNHNLIHSVFLDQGHGMAQFMGMKLAGTNNSVINSEFSYAASMCIWIGPGGLIQNNSFDHIGYDGMWGAPVSWWGFDNCNGIQVLNNTATVLGRGFVDNGFATGPNQGQADGLTKNTINNEIAYNDISYFSSRCQDGGAFYSSQYQNLSGLKIHNNWVHDMPSFKPPDGTLTDGIMAGIYFDQGSGANTGGTQVRVYNNVFWRLGGGLTWSNTEISDIYTLPYCGGCSYHPSKLSTLYYNNTNASGTVGANGIKSYVSYQSTITDVFANNIFLGEITFAGGSAPAYFGASNKYRVDPSFAGGSLSTPAAYFQLQSGSSARGIGVSVPTNTDDVPPLDAGAYYYSQTAWTNPGYSAVTYVPTP